MTDMNFQSKPGEYTYVQTEYGKEAYGVVKNGAQSERDPSAQRQAGHEERQVHDQGGHLIPHSQGGRNDETNLVAQDANVNQVDVRGVERTNSELAKDPNNTVYVHVSAYTQPGHERPDAFMITSAVQNSETGHIDIQHSSYTNASHAEQSEWNALVDQDDEVDSRQDIGMTAEERALANEYADVNVEMPLGSASTTTYTMEEAQDQELDDDQSSGEEEGMDDGMDYGMSM